MKKYQTTKGLDLPSIDKEILKKWAEHDVFNKSVEERSKDNSFVFYEGPPSANGKPGIHHVMARAIKDIFCRFQTMQGKRVERKGGWDTHGLPIELSVEKELGITKEDIGKTISIEEYNKKCKETVMRYKNLWDDITVKMGYWVDLENPYITFEKEYIESVWWILKNLYDKGLIYKGYTVQPYSPAAGTGLSSHELNMPGAYKDVSDTSAVAQFKVVRDDKSAFLYEGIGDADVHIIAWTTTPWTLPSNTMLAMGAKIDYVRVQTFNPYTKLPVHLILAKDLVGKWFKEEQAELDFDAYTPEDKKIPYRITAEFKGAQFDRISYEQLLDYQQPEEGNAFIVGLADFVSTSDGTGIVHIAPSFGSDDMRVAQRYDVGALTLVDKQGKFVEGVGEFSGRYVKDYKDQGADYKNTDIDIAIKLKTENKAFNVQKYSHNYPHCWRTDKPILYYPLDSWFVRARQVKEKMVALNKTINWKPQSTGEGRFGNWLENVLDWNLSRSRYWGIPLPIWRSEDEEEKCIGSIEELTKEIEKANTKLGLSQLVPEDLHRPYIDDVILVSDSGKEMKRELDLIDVWFDSGAMPFAQLHYPFENKELVDEGTFYPADFISEGVDQTRGWFYTLHAISSMVKDSVAFKNVVSTGLVLDKNGQKMSKRLGNAADPFETLDKYGADATRWYMMTNSNPWDNLKFDLDGIEEVRRKFFGTLYNTYSFYALYANIDGFAYAEDELEIEKRPEIDRWIISLLNSLVKEVETDYAEYEPTRAGRKIQSFVEDNLSNWYVRLCRRRFWKGEYSEDKISAYQTLYTCMKTIAKLMAPISPFFSDWLYGNLNGVSGQEEHVSVHLALFPKSNPEFIDKDLERRMSYAQRISSLVLSLRRNDKLRVRQPLQKIMLPVMDSNFESDVKKVEGLILHEVNVKEIDYISDTTGVFKKKIKPNFKTLGKRLGKNMKAGAGIIAQLGQDDIAQIEKDGKYTLSFDDGPVELGLADFEILAEEIPGWQVAQDKEITVALDVNITPDLRSEWIARELVNRIQNIRKDSGLDVIDRIIVSLDGGDEINAAAIAHKAYVCNEVLADDLLVDGSLSGEAIDIDGELKVKIGVSKQDS